MSSYTITTDQDVRRIFPKGKNGKSVCVTLAKYTLSLKHTTSGEIVEFSRYKHQGRWLFRDSRDTRSASQKMITKEIARMLKVDLAKARQLVFEHLIAV